MPKTSADPTREQMHDTLDSLPCSAEFDEFDVEEAIYWFACNWHGGQWTESDSVLSTSDYHPGISAPMGKANWHRSL